MALTIGELVGYIKADSSDFDKGVDGAESKFEGLGSRLGKIGKMVGATAGAGIAAGAAAGLMHNLELGGVMARMQAQLGATGPEAERLGGIAGDLYADAYGESVSEVGAALTSVMQNVDGMASATESELKAVTGQMMSMAQTMEMDIGQASAAVGQMIRTGLADSAQEAMDVLTAATQEGANRLGDLGDTANEYATNFRALGLSGQQAMGLITQAMDGGARSSDQAADALKEFSIRAAEGGTQAEEGFTAIGLSAEEMADKISQGGPVAAEALDLTLRKLQQMPPGAERSAAAMALFGAQGEDMAGALNSMSLDGAVDALGNVAGASQRADEALQETASKRLSEVTRGFQAMAGAAMNLPGPLGTASAAVLTYGSQAMTTLAPLALMASASRNAGRAAKASAATQAAANTTVAASSARTRIATVAMTVLRGAWIKTAAVAMGRAAIMAGAWLVAMGPIGWVTAAVIGLVALIIWKWDEVSSATSTAWSTITGYVSRAANSVGSWINRMLGYVQSIPGRVRGALSGAGSWLLQAGRNIVQGLIDGILSMLGSVGNAASQVASTVRSYLPFSPAEEGPLAGSGAPSIAGAKISEMLASGMLGKLGDVTGASSKLAAAAAVSGSGDGRVRLEQGRSRGGRDTEIREGVRAGVADALDGARMRIDGKGVARLVNRTNRDSERRGGNGGRKAAVGL